MGVEGVEREVRHDRGIGRVAGAHQADQVIGQALVYPHPHRRQELVVGGFAKQGVPERVGRLVDAFDRDEDPGVDDLLERPQQRVLVHPRCRDQAVVGHAAPDHGGRTHERERRRRKGRQSQPKDVLERGWEVGSTPPSIGDQLLDEERQAVGPLEEGVYACGSRGLAQDADELLVPAPRDRTGVARDARRLPRGSTRRSAGGRGDDGACRRSGRSRAGAAVHGACSSPGTGPGCAWIRRPNGCPRGRGRAAAFVTPGRGRRGPRRTAARVGRKPPANIIRGTHGLPMKVRDESAQCVSGGPEHRRPVRGIETPGERTERLDERRVRWAALAEIQAAAGDRRAAGSLDDRRELRHEAALADAGLTSDQDERWLSGRGPLERLREPHELCRPTDEVGAAYSAGHTADHERPVPTRQGARRRSGGLRPQPADRREDGPTRRPRTLPGRGRGLRPARHRRLPEAGVCRAAEIVLAIAAGKSSGHSSRVAHLYLQSIPVGSVRWRPRWD